MGKLRKKYIKRYQQGGGVQPSFQGVQALSNPIQPGATPAPQVYDPSAAFNAYQTVDRRAQTLVDAGKLIQDQRRLEWQIEVDQRDYLQERLDYLRTEFDAAEDDLTKLNMNIPEQMAMANNIRASLGELNKTGVDILMDESLTPQERSIKLQEQVGKATDLMKDPNYLRFVQRNAITKNLYNNVVENLGKDDTIVDFNIVNKNLSLADEYLKGKISDNQFFTGLKNYTMDIKQADEFEKSIYTLMNDALTKGPKNWEKYAGDENAIVFIEKMHIASSEDQINTLYDYLMSNEVWKKRQETRSRFTGEDGLIDPNKVRDYAKNTVNFYRKQYGISPEAQDFTTDTKTNVLRQGTQSTTHQQEVINYLNRKGYDVVDPSIIQSGDSGVAIERLLGSDDSKLTKDELEYKRQLESAVVPKKESGETSSTSTPNYSSSISYGERSTYRHPITVQSESGFRPAVQSGGYYTIDENGKRKNYVSPDTPGAKREDSYGLYQFNVDNGLAGKFIEYAKSHGVEVPDNIDTKNGEQVRNWFNDQEALDSESFSRMQEKFVTETIEPGVISKFQSKFGDITVDSGLADILLSTEIQFGKGGYNNMLNDINKDKPNIKTREEFIDALTKARIDKNPEDTKRYNWEAGEAKKATGEIKPVISKPQAPVQSTNPASQFEQKFISGKQLTPDEVKSVLFDYNPKAGGGTRFNHIRKGKMETSPIYDAMKDEDAKNLVKRIVASESTIANLEDIIIDFSEKDRDTSNLEERLKNETEARDRLKSNLNSPEFINALTETLLPNESRQVYEKTLDMILADVGLDYMTIDPNGIAIKKSVIEGRYMVKQPDGTQKIMRKKELLDYLMEKAKGFRDIAFAETDPRSLVDLSRYQTSTQQSNSIPQVGNKPSPPPATSVDDLTNEIDQIISNQ